MDHEPGNISNETEDHYELKQKIYHNLIDEDIYNIKYINNRSEEIILHALQREEKYLLENNLLKDNIIHGTSNLWPYIKKP